MEADFAVEDARVLDVLGLQLDLLLVDWQMIFGVNTLPSYRKHGYAGELIKRAITDAKEQGRKGLVLTCKDRLISYYARFGFKNEGVSESVHGNVVWNQMRLTFDEGLGE